MISGATGKEFDETKYENMTEIDSLRAQLADGVMTLDFMERRVRELESEIEQIKMSGMLSGSIPITPMMIAAGHSIKTMREVLAENGRALPVEPTKTPSSYTETGQALQMLDKMTPEEFEAWNERELKRQKYDNPKPEYEGGPTYYDENTQIWDD